MVSICDIFNPKSIFGKIINEEWCKSYTTDKKFLKDTQKLLKTYKEYEQPKPNLKNIENIWLKIKTNGNFRLQYQYMEWKFLEHLNNSAPFLQIMSIYNMISPIISLMMPFVMLFIPFIILQTKKINITFNQYIHELKIILKDHAIGQLIFEFKNLEWGQRFYLLLSIGFYFFKYIKMFSHVLTFIQI